MLEARARGAGRRRRPPLLLLPLLLLLGCAGAARAGGGLSSDYDFEARVGSYDGWGNNPEHPSWGAAGERMVRAFVGPAYADGEGAAAGGDRPTARRRRPRDGPSG